MRVKLLASLSHGRDSRKSYSGDGREWGGGEVDRGWGAEAGTSWGEGVSRSEWSVPWERKFRGDAG